MAKKKKPMPNLEGAKALPHRRLAEGEVTGHFHEAQEGTTLLELPDSEGMVMVVPEEGTTIKHPEHKEVAVPTGTFKIGAVQEYDPFQDASRNARD